jgi:hypothetical protein
MAAAKAGIIVAAIQRIGKVISDQANIADEAAKLGMDPDKYDKLRFAAEMYGLSIEDVAKGLVKVNNVLDEAATKGGPNAEVLRALGFAQDDITNRAIRTQEVYERLAEAIAEAGSEEEKFALASRVFGDRQAQGMVPILANWKEFNQAAETASSLTNQNAEAFDNFSDRIDTAYNDAIKLFTNAGGSLIRSLGLDKPMAAQVPEADKAEARARGKAAREALLKAGAPKAGKPEVDQLTMAAIGGASAQTLRGVGMKRPEEETAENTRRLVELATGGPPVADTGSTRGFTNPTSAGLSMPGVQVINTGNILKTGMGIAPAARPAR